MTRPVKPHRPTARKPARRRAKSGRSRPAAGVRDHLEQIVDQANVLVIATDLGGRVTVWNRAMARLTGFPRETVVGRDLLPWLSEVGMPELAQIMKQVADGGDLPTCEVRLPSVSGTVAHATFNVAVVRAEGGRPSAVLAVGQDVTALRVLQNQVIHAEKLATVGQIAAGVAHEINNPLTSIQACVEAVLHKASMAVQGRVPNQIEPVDLERLKRIQDGVERIRRFTHDLVGYARPSRVEIERLDLNEVVEHALSFCEHIFVEAKATLDRDLAANLPPVRAVRDQVMQVVTNLVTNAAQALGEKGGTIRVRTFHDGEAAVGLAVTDTGSGIREEHRASIFDPFFTTKPAGSGTGLGLSVVRNIVYAHGGQITFQSKLGSGTTFVVTLPVSHPISHNIEGEKPTP
ncbi:MAG: ATP-binding protein [Polyangia bacterium]|jgi:PAS domain S-box-containing protein